MRGSSLAALMLAVSLAAPVARGHPVTYPGNTMAMVEAGDGMLDANVWYTFAPAHAAGPGFMRLTADDRGLRREIPNLHYNYRLKRWNLPDAQANVYLQAGVGAATGSDFAGTRSTFMPGMQADYETRHLYLAWRSHVLRSGAFHHNLSSLQLGFSPVRPDYERMQPWAVLEVRYASGIDDKPTVTPMLRLIRKEMFLELGVSRGGKPRLTLMLNL